MKKVSKLAIVTTHPVQYHVPWLSKLAEEDFAIKVFYTWEQSSTGNMYDEGFGKKIKWDIPLLQGYEYEFVKNSSLIPGLNNFFGIINPGLIASIESWGADSLMVIGWNYQSHLKCLLHFHKKIPVLFRGDSILLYEKTGLKKIARKIFLNWVYSHIDYALYVGTHNKAYYLKYGIKSEQLIYSPHAIDVDRFAGPEDNYTRYAQDWKKKLGIPEHHLIVLFAGKMTHNKNVGFVIRLAEDCSSLPVSFILAGDGKLKNRLQHQTSGNSRIFYLDFQNQSIMPALYRVGDIFILPSRTETWGMGVNEAMASGRPVMVSDKVGCAIDLVKDSRTGIVFSLEDTKKCVQFLNELCKSRYKVIEMGAHS